MRYLSPTSFMAWESDPRAWVKSYLGRERDVQTVYMATGTVFDNMVKHRIVSGNEDFTDAILGSNVEPIWLEEGVRRGKVVYESYKAGGHVDYVIGYLRTCLRFSVTTAVEGTLSHAGVTVPLLGKPDLVAIESAGLKRILDWKVNWGTKYPPKGYEGHKDWMGFPCVFENVKEEWATQLCFYNWITGAGAAWGGWIEQVTEARVARFRGIVEAEYDNRLRDRVVRMWDHITRRQWVPDLSVEENERLVASYQVQPGTKFS